MLNRGELIGLDQPAPHKGPRGAVRVRLDPEPDLQLQPNLPEAIKAIEESAAKSLTKEHSTAFGSRRTGRYSSGRPSSPSPPPSWIQAALERITGTPKGEGKINFQIGGSGYFGVFKYNDKWDVYIVRAEETREFQKDTDAIFYRVAGIILLLTAILIGLGGGPLHGSLPQVTAIRVSTVGMP